MTRYAFLAAFLVAITTPALAAEFYLAQDPETKRCKVVPEKPDGQTMVMVGTEPYATKEDAKAARRASTECKKKDDAN